MNVAEQLFLSAGCLRCRTVSSDFADWVKLELLLSTFDSSRFMEETRRVGESGVVISTLAELGDTPDQRRKLYELNAECSSDIPDRGEFHTWEQYQAVRLGASSFLPHGVVLAIHGNNWVGMSQISHRPGYPFAFQEMTGTTRSHRGLGIAITMKVAAVEVARGLGVDSLRTIHHPDNEAMIALNRKLGFVEADFVYPIP